MKVGHVLEFVLRQVRPLCCESRLKRASRRGIKFRLHGTGDIGKHGHQQPPKSFKPLEKKLPHRTDRQRYCRAGDQPDKPAADCLGRFQPVQPKLDARLAIAANSLIQLVQLGVDGGKLALANTLVLAAFGAHIQLALFNTTGIMPPAMGTYFEEPTMDKSISRIRLASYMTILISLAITLSILWHVSSEPLGAFSIIVAIWNALPFSVLLLLVRFMGRSTRQAKAVLGASLVVVGFGVAVLTDGFFIHLDAQNALLFIFLPVYQLLGCLVATIIGACLKPATTTNPPA
jgi:hypothetical protein